MPEDDHPATWTLTLPRGYTTRVADNLIAAASRSGNLRLERHGTSVTVTRQKDPSPLVVPLDWRYVAGAGVIGDAGALLRQLQSWPPGALRPILDPATGPGLLRDFQSKPLPATALELAEASSSIESILHTAPDATTLVAYIDAICRHLSSWYPGGQMNAWGINYLHMQEARPLHLDRKSTRLNSSH